MRCVMKRMAIPSDFIWFSARMHLRQIRGGELLQRLVQDEEPGPFLQGREDGDEDPVGEVEVLDDRRSGPG